MKPLVIAAALVLAAVVAGVVFLWPQPTTGHEPILYGRDTCAYCRMHISRPGFGAEVRDEKGALTKYDDIGCMLRMLHDTGSEPAEAWVEDHGSAGFVPLRQAHFVDGDEVRTPMGYGIVAFADEEIAAEFARTHGAETKTLEELLGEPPQPPRAPQPQAR